MKFSPSNNTFSILLLFISTIMGQKGPRNFRFARQFSGFRVPPFKIPGSAPVDRDLKMTNHFNSHYEQYILKSAGCTATSTIVLNRYFNCSQPNVNN